MIFTSFLFEFFIWKRKMPYWKGGGGDSFSTNNNFELQEWKTQSSKCSLGLESFFFQFLRIFIIVFSFFCSFFNCWNLIHHLKSFWTCVWNLFWNYEFLLHFHFKTISFSCICCNYNHKCTSIKQRLNILLKFYD
jgi:hypothetical protein